MSNDKFTARELATILAALRWFQRTDSAETPEENEIAIDGGAFDALSNHEIDVLCERLNCADASVPCLTVPPKQVAIPRTCQQQKGEITHA
jgi:hypothetical protein